jgi:hypothetical protein
LKLEKSIKQTNKYKADNHPNKGHIEKQHYRKASLTRLPYALVLHKIADPKDYIKLHLVIKKRTTICG